MPESADISPFPPGVPPYLLFLSHSSKTEASRRRLVRIAELVEKLAGPTAPVRVIFDREQIVGGDDWRRRIAFLLHVCDGAAALLDEEAVASTWVWQEVVFLSLRQRGEESFRFVPVSLVPVDALADPGSERGDGTERAGAERAASRRSVREKLADGQWRQLALTDTQFVDGCTEQEVAERLLQALRVHEALEVHGSPTFLLADQIAPLLADTGPRSLARLTSELGEASGYLGHDQARRAALGLVRCVLRDGALATARALVDGLGLRFCRTHGRDLLGELSALPVSETAAALLTRRRASGAYAHSWLRCDRPDWVVPLYLRRAFLGSNLPRHFAVTNVHGTTEDLQAQVRAQYRLKYGDLNGDPRAVLDDGVVDDLLRRAPGFVWVDGPVDADVLAELEAAYPPLAFIVHEPHEPDDEPDDQPDPSLSPQLLALRPTLTRSQERDLMLDHHLALEGL